MPATAAPGVLNVSIEVPEPYLGCPQKRLVITTAVPDLTRFVRLVKEMNKDPAPPKRIKSASEACKTSAQKKRVAEKMFELMTPHEQDFAVLVTKLMETSMVCRAPTEAGDEDVNAPLERVHVRTVADDSPLMELDSAKGQTMHSGFARDGRSKAAATVRFGGDAMQLRVYKPKGGAWEKLYES